MLFCLGWQHSTVLLSKITLKYTPFTFVIYSLTRIWCSFVWADRRANLFRLVFYLFTLTRLSCTPCRVLPDFSWSVPSSMFPPWLPMVPTPFATLFYHPVLYSWLTVLGDEWKQNFGSVSSPNTSKPHYPHPLLACSLSLRRAAHGSKRMFLELTHGLFIT